MKREKWLSSFDLLNCHVSNTVNLCSVFYEEDKLINVLLSMVKVFDCSGMVLVHSRVLSFDLLETNQRY